MSAIFLNEITSKSLRDRQIFTPKTEAQLKRISVALTLTITLVLGWAQTASVSLAKGFEPPPNGAPNDRDDAGSR